jgi:hypothetical protein
MNMVTPKKSLRNLDCSKNVKKTGLINAAVLRKTCKNGDAKNKKSYSIFVSCRENNKFLKLSSDV